MTTSDFVALSEEVGIRLPDLLRELIVAGRTAYSEDFSSTWRARAMHDPVALQSRYDFEWIEPSESLRLIDSWLSPDHQGGRKFLPFANAGSGDVYALIPNGDEVGVGLVRHDDDTSAVEYTSFLGFVCSSFLETFADLSHLLDDFTEQEAVTVARADVMRIAVLMPDSTAQLLSSLVEREPIYREYKDGPRARPRKTLSLISQDEMERGRSAFVPFSPIRFPVVVRWDVER